MKKIFKNIIKALFTILSISGMTIGMLIVGIYAFVNLVKATGFMAFFIGLLGILSIVFGLVMLYVFGDRFNR